MNNWWEEDHMIDIPGTSQQAKLVYLQQLPSGRRAITQGLWKWRKLAFEFTIKIDHDHAKEGWLVHELEHCRQIIRNPFHGFLYKFKKFRYQYELKAYAAQYLSMNNPNQALIDLYALWITRDYSLNVTKRKATADLKKMIKRAKR